VGLGSWRPSNGGPSSQSLHLRGIDTRIAALIEAAQPSLTYEEFEWLRRAALSDAVAWDREFGRVKDVSRLGVERNLFRYRPVAVAVRATREAEWQAVLRVVIAGQRAAERFTLSLPVGMPAAVRRALGDLDVAVFVESDEQWIERMAGRVAEPDAETGVVQTADQILGIERERPPRVRLVGPRDAVAELHRALADGVGGDPDLAIYSGEVTTAGRIELLPFLREQAISITAHRFGAPDDLSDDVI
jgi:RHH-type proline utilization regulon transcriptional repressor/proline dehydrogenase/delta 1-pyrroline-5-carboxylate dehydrogenase